MRTTGTVVIGGGQAGLAVSYLLTCHGHDHVVLERGRVGQRWRTGSWDSLRLQTPNWMSRLPGLRYHGPRIDGYMTATEVVELLDGYASSFHAPVEAGTTVTAVRGGGSGFEVHTDHDLWLAGAVVIATGWCDRPVVPEAAATLDAAVDQVVASAYRRPAQLRDGGVLVVGASASGVQIADELRRAGRRVVLAAGNHTRLPRTYRGMDIYWWLDATGSLDRAPADQQASDPSLQVTGRPSTAVDLPALAAAGVTLTGRLVAADGQRVRFADDLATTTAAADDRMSRVLHRIDAYIDRAGLTREVLPRERAAPAAAGAPPSALDLHADGIRTVVWATGYRRSYPWLHLPVLDDRGELTHHDGVTPVPGLYVMGQRFQRTRRSTYLDGVGADAGVVTDHLLHTTRERTTR
jgi:putative flavoprotein involved in K+ transport